MTFSIAGRCARTGALGVAITSSSPAVASRCAHVRPGVGAVCTQNVTDPRLGPALLDALGLGATAREAMADVSSRASSPEYRQLTAVDSRGGTAVFSGSLSLGINGDLIGPDCVVAGNMLASLAVLDAAAAAFRADPGSDLGERLVSALEAGLAAGGEAGPLHSAGLLVAGEAMDEGVEWPTTNLRVDWSEQPIGDLRALWTLWLPQRDDYVTRALNPAGAPGYGVPGDDRAPAEARVPGDDR
jgi:uncharacterized Ntn-hydrolase superfamily protein